jgi:hypothetical protein
MMRTKVLRIQQHPRCLNFDITGVNANAEGDLEWVALLVYAGPVGSPEDQEFRHESLTNLLDNVLGDLEDSTPWRELDKATRRGLILSTECACGAQPGQGCVNRQGRPYKHGKDSHTARVMAAMEEYEKPTDRAVCMRCNLRIALVPNDPTCPRCERDELIYAAHSDFRHWWANATD